MDCPLKVALHGLCHQKETPVNLMSQMFLRALPDHPSISKNEPLLKLVYEWLAYSVSYPAFLVVNRSMLYWLKTCLQWKE